MEVSGHPRYSSSIFIVEVPIMEVNPVMVMTVT